MTSSGTQGDGGHANFSGALATQAIELLPPEVKDLIKPGKTPDRIQHAINWASRRDKAVLAQHQAHGHKIGTFEDIRTLKVEQADKVAKHFARSFRRRAMLTGAITGLPGGLWALVAASADVQLTAVYSVRMVADIAQSYGYDTSLADEQTHLAEVLAIAAGIDSLRGVGNWVTREGLVHVLPELLPKVLIKLSVKLTQEQAAKWVGRLIPGVGAVVGGAIDYSFLRVAGDRAIAYYHHRYLVDHGLAAPDVLPPAPQRPALPPGTAQRLGASSPGMLSQQAAGGQQKALKPPRPLKERRSAPERFAIFLGIFAIFALLITIAAIIALGILISSGLHTLIH